MGDLQAMAELIRDSGLLQPIGITEERDLVFGERRLRAARDILGWEEIPAWVVSVTSLLKGERDENEVRKGFTISERVAIGKALELEIGNRKGQRTDLAPRENFPEVDSRQGERTSETVARFAGFGNRRTYEQAKSVTERGAPELVEALDKELISVSRAERVLALPPEEQARIGGECINGRNRKAAKAAAVGPAERLRRRIKTITGRTERLTESLNDQFPRLLKSAKQAAELTPELAEPLIQALREAEQTLAKISDGLALEFRSRDTRPILTR